MPTDFKRKEAVELIEFIVSGHLEMKLIRNEFSVVSTEGAFYLI